MAAKNGKKVQPAPQKVSRFKVLLGSRKRLAIAIVVLAAVGYFGYNRYKAATTKPTYQTASVTKGTLIQSVSESGQILSSNIINISTSASGIVSNVYVKDGDKVSTGQKIAQVTLDSAGQEQYAQASASYLSAKHSLDSANATLYSLQSTMFSDWKAYTDLATNSTYQNADGSPNEGNRTLPAFTTVQDNWFKAEADYKNQQGAIAAAEATLNNDALAYQQASPTITSPTAGTIGNLEIIPGMILGSQGSSVSVGTGGSVGSSQNTQRVAVIQNNGLPVATFNASETDIGSIKIGQEATITLNAFANKTFTGKVAAVDNIGTVSSGVTNYTVLIAFDSDAPGVLPNMAASADIITDVKNDVLLVPSTAVLSTGGQDTVRVFKNGNVQTVPVVVGESSDTDSEIVSGLSEGDTIVTSVVTPQTGGSTGATSPFGGGGAGGGGGRVFFRGGGG